MENIILAYTGAIIDGEGCIFISKKKNKNLFNYQLEISIANTSKELIDFLFKNFKGNIRIGKKIENQKQFWIWDLTGYKNIISFLEQVIPYLLIKRKQGKLALEFAKKRENINSLGKNCRGYTEEQIKIYSELKRLKKEYPIELPNYNFIEEEKLYYLAGLIDGEGCVRITKAIHKNEYGNEKLILVPMISIANTDKRISDFLMKEFQGFTMKKERYAKHRSIYQWHMQGINKKEFYLKLKDKLIIKNEQLKLILKYIESKSKSYRIKEEDIQIFLDIKKLNDKNKKEYNLEELKKYTELIRNPRKFFLEKEKLQDLYINKKLSIRQIAELYDVAFDTVRLRIIKYGIKIRNSKEGRLLHQPKLTEEGRNKIKKAVSQSRKEDWQNPLYRDKMLKNLEVARNIKKQEYLKRFNYLIDKPINLVKDFKNG